MERDLAGFPVLYAPADMDVWDDTPEMQQTLARAERIVSSIRRDAREGLVLPGGENGWKLELISSGSRRQFDTNAIIDRYDKRIATSVLADFVMLGQQAVGSFALADSKTQIFAMAIGTYLDVICEVFNNQGIPKLIDLNGEHFNGITDYPKMVHGDIDEPDLQQFASFVKEMVGAGVIIPDDAIEKEIRRIGHLPDKVETDTPAEKQPGEDGPRGQRGDPDSKSVYKVTAILEKYQSGKMSRDVAASLLEGVGLNDEKIEFYLKDAERTTQDAADEQAAEAAKKSLGRK